MSDFREKIHDLSRQIAESHSVDTLIVVAAELDQLEKDWKPVEYASDNYHNLLELQVMKSIVQERITAMTPVRDQYVVEEVQSQPQIVAAPHNVLEVKTVTHPETRRTPAEMRIFILRQRQHN